MPSPRAATEKRQDAQLLRTLPSFASLTDESRERLIAAASVQRFAAGATLFRAGEPAAGLFVILVGQVRVLRARDGRQRVIHSEGPGGTLGEVPLFEGGVMPATAEALTSVRCLHVTGEALSALIHADPSIALLFLRRLASRVRGLVERLDRDATVPVARRLAAFVLDRATASPVSSFALGMTQEALAEELGTVREVIVRGLGRLKRDSVILAAGKGRFTVGNVDALRRLAQG